MEIENMILVL